MEGKRDSTSGVGKFTIAHHTQQQTSTPSKALKSFIFNTYFPIRETLHLIEFCLYSNFLFSSQG